ncbi:MAG: type IX secretion system plug protein domain-containing protein [Bacteroidota bacterium]
MLSRNQIKHVSALRQKKYRDEYSQFIAEGEKLVIDLVNSPFKIVEIFASAPWIVANLPLLRQKEIPVYETLPMEMERISALTTPSPVLAVVTIPAGERVSWRAGELTNSPTHQLTNSLFLALDDIRDPGNLGTIIRIADWFGIKTIFCSEQSVELYNPKVVQATMGSIVRVRVIHCNLAETLAVFSGCSIPVFGAFLEGENLYEQTLPSEGVILIGNESRGISSELEPFVTKKLFIPSYGPADADKAESLNASVATAIICSEFRRNHLPSAISHLLALVIFLLSSFTVFARDLPNENTVYDPAIKTIQVYKSGFEMSAPVIQLNSEEKMVISFDDLDPGIKRYKYTIRHCESNWSTSEGVDAVDYIAGYREENIDRFEYSYNTTVKYTHFTAIFPSAGMQPKISGNYLLIVYEDDISMLAFTWRFMVVEASPVTTSGTVVQCTRMEDHFTRQQIDFVVKMNGMTALDINREIKVVIQQNSRWDNLLVVGKPRFIRNDELDYRYDESIAFDAGNQYRSFDTKSLLYQSERIEKIRFDTTNQVFLVSDLPRPFKQYVFEKDLNGKFYIKNEEHAENSNTEADYAWIHFFLPYPALLTTGQFYVIGELTRWEVGDAGKMSYNFARKGYELNLFLKQGYYNYLYVFREKNRLQGDVGFIEGNHWETENDYTLFIYFHETGSLYDRLIAVNFLNSVQK